MTTDDSPAAGGAAEGEGGRVEADDHHAKAHEAKVHKMRPAQPAELPQRHRAGQRGADLLVLLVAVAAIVVVAPSSLPGGGGVALVGREQREVPVRRGEGAVALSVPGRGWGVQ